MLPENPAEARQILDRCSAVIILIGGLESFARYAMKTANSCPPNHRGRKRASKPYKHRGEGRRVLGTSKDVMPAMAGYTSTPCDHDNCREGRAR